MRKSLFVIVLSMVCSLLWGQTLTSYTCDFEDPQEMQNWTINAGARGQSGINKWYRGAAGSFGLNSQNGFYISTAADTTVSTYGATTGGFVVAYRPMTLAAGTYSLVFDWIGAGQSSDAVYVCWLPASITTNSNYGNNSSIGTPSWLPGNEVMVHGSYNWQSATGTFTSDGSAGKLVVVFFYTKGTPQLPSFAIDNISIYQGTCATPTNVSYDGNTVSLSWTGSASSTYDVLVFNNHTQASTSYVGVQGTTCPLAGLTEEGMYYFYVRNVCDSVCHSPWVFTSKFVWIKGARCIDFLDLTPDNSGAAKCYWTTASDYDSDLHQHSGQVDYGFANELSRHTIHYVQGETDARTGGRLKTIPNGEIASVRVGGLWESAGHTASTIEYDYTVEAGVSDLLVLKYACILQSGGHPENVQPRFKLEVLRGNTVIDPCAQCDFKPGFGDTRNWHTVGDVYWCDWQTITVSLRNYVGQTLKIRLTAYDCTDTIHFGYAYFTLNCQGGDLQGVACGDYNVDRFQAPDGFDYRWYKASDPSTIKSDSSVLHITTQDTAIYCVDLITKGKSNCYYTLTANPNPRGPKALVNVSASPTDCKNTVVFTNSSAVMRTNRVTGVMYVDTTEHITSLLWDFGDGTPIMDDQSTTITHQYSDDGGSYTVRVMAGMSGDVCVDTLEIPINMPDLHAAAYTDTVNTCAESYRDSHGRIRYATGGDFIDTLGIIINQYGCTADSLRWVYFRKETLHVDSALICENEAFRWYADNKDYRAPYAIDEPTDFTFELRDISSEGCDSITRLILSVNPIVRTDLQAMAASMDTLLVCPDGRNIEIPYEYYTGLVDSVVVTMAKALDGSGDALHEVFALNDPIVLSVSDTLRPDVYTAYVEFASEACPAAPVPVVFETMYLPRIAMQKDGFIAILNENYNYGHYKFDQFQWYKNGQPIIGAIQSYIAVEPTDLGSVFFVILRREGEERYYRSCDFVYYGYNDLDETFDAADNTPRKLIHNGQLYITCEGRWFDAFGRETASPFAK